MSTEKPPIPPNLEGENVPEMSPEDFEEMISQIPVLKEMLEERKRELEKLGKDPHAPAERIEELRTEIEELDFEIKGREEASEER